MKHIFVAYTILSGLLPLFYGEEPTYFTLFGTEFERDWYIRDFLVYSGYALSPCVTFIKEETIRLRCAKVLITQGIFSLLVLHYNNFAYDPMSNMIQCLIIAGSIYYIYRKNKAHEPTHR